VRMEDFVLAGASGAVRKAEKHCRWTLNANNFIECER
jgi:hypothetical protein